MGREMINAIRDSLIFYRELGFQYIPGDRDIGSCKVHTDPSRTPFIKEKINDPDAELDSLRKEIGDCHRCKLSSNRTHIVFGEGSSRAEIMFIGEAPGREEDIQARPFVGDAGKLLTSLIEKMGLRRDEVYIGNIVKCRPPYNRDPEEDEIDTCRQFIERQIDIIKPRVIISLGRISAQSLLNTRIPISKLRGRFWEYKGIALMPTFHPAYLLRNPKDKWLTWQDAMMVLERLGRK